jgi:2-keto-3-deoxy-L-rhamnonate aldolase RhmA
MALVAGAVAAVASIATVGAMAQATHENAVIDVWMQGKPVFGVYAPNENPQPRQRGVPPPKPMYTKAGGEKLAMNPLYDYVFLNLEGGYDPAFVTAMVEGLRSPKAVSRKTLIVRIPPIDRDGAATTKARVKEILDAGADGVTIPHVTSVEQAKEAIGYFEAAGADVWSPANPSGEKLAMLMIEDPGALAQATAFADLKGYSILACGIGSLSQALGGDRAGAEKGTQTILAETKRVKLVNMLTASPKDVEQRVKEGFLALLAQGASADETIKLGRAAAGR